MPKPKRPIAVHREWVDGINPWALPERQEAIKRTRAARQAEIEEWKKKHPES